MEAYLDNSATTRCCEEAAQLVVKLLTEDYGNPSSLHNKGVIAENYMNDARKKIAKTLKVQEKEICFTSGGTESNNLAICNLSAKERLILRSWFPSRRVVSYNKAFIIVKDSIFAT